MAYETIKIEIAEEVKRQAEQILEAAYVRRRIPVFPGHHRGPGSTKV